MANDTKTKQQATATDDSSWSVIWDPSTVTGKDDDGFDAPGSEPQALDYEDAYDEFLDNLNDLIVRAFGTTDTELTLHCATSEKAKTDRISGNLAQDLIDTFFPNAEKVMKFRLNGNTLVAEILVAGNSHTDTYSFNKVAADEATASEVAIGKWEFLPNVFGQRKPADFMEVGSARPKDYSDFLRAISQICSTQELSSKASAWVERNKGHEKLQGLESFAITFRGNKQTPIIMVSNGQVAMALLFKPSGVDMVRSVGTKSQPVGRWTWDARFSRISVVAIITYLLGTLAAQLRGEYQVR